MAENMDLRKAALLVRQARMKAGVVFAVEAVTVEQPHLFDIEVARAVIESLKHMSPETLRAMGMHVNDLRDHMTLEQWRRGLSVITRREPVGIDA